MFLFLLLCLRFCDCWGDFLYVDAGMEDKRGECVGNVELEDMVLPNFGNAIFWNAFWQIIEKDFFCIPAVI